MYYDFMVPLPDVKGEITLMKKGDIRYVQLETGRVYLPERKYTIPQRVTIGKLSAEQPARMYPNEKIRIISPSRSYRKNARTRIEAVH